MKSRCQARDLLLHLQGLRRVSRRFRQRVAQQQYELYLLVLVACRQPHLPVTNIEYDVLICETAPCDGNFTIGTLARST